MLNKMTKITRTWHSRKFEVSTGNYSKGMSAEKLEYKEECNQDMASLKTQIDLITKQLIGVSTEKVNADTSV